MIEGSRKNIRIQSKINNKLSSYVQVPKANIKMDPDTRLKGGKQILTNSQGKLLFVSSGSAQNQTKCLDHFHAFIQFNTNERLNIIKPS